MLAELRSTSHGQTLVLTISNPDLARRLQENAPLNELFADVGLYGGTGAHGYTDYPSLPV